MLYYEFEAGNKNYKLRLNTRNIITLEKLLGTSPLAIFNGDIPTLTSMASILYCSLQQYHHGISLDDAYDIFDIYLEDHTLPEFLSVITEVYKVSGLIKTNTEKN